MPRVGDSNFGGPNLPSITRSNKTYDRAVKIFRKTTTTIAQAALLDMRELPRIVVHTRTGKHASMTERVDGALFTIIVIEFNK